MVAFSCGQPGQNRVSVYLCGRRSPCRSGDAKCTTATPELSLLLKQVQPPQPPLLYLGSVRSPNLRPPDSSGWSREVSSATEDEVSWVRGRNAVRVFKTPSRDTAELRRAERIQIVIIYEFRLVEPEVMNCSRPNLSYNQSLSHQRFGHRAFWSSLPRPSTTIPLMHRILEQRSTRDLRHRPPRTPGSSARFQPRRVPTAR